MKSPTRKQFMNLPSKHTDDTMDIEIRAALASSFLKLHHESSHLVLKEKLRRNPHPKEARLRYGQLSRQTDNPFMRGIVHQAFAAAQHVAFDLINSSNHNGSAHDQSRNTPPIIIIAVTNPYRFAGTILQ